MVTLNFETIIPANPIIKVNSYVVIPAFNYAGIGWKGASEVVTQFCYSATKNFVLKRLPIKPTGVNYCPVIRYRIGYQTFRYKLWQDVSEGLPEMLYAGEVIKKNFVIEIWNTQNSETVSNVAAITLLLSIRSFPEDLTNIVNVLDNSPVEENNLTPLIQIPSAPLAGYNFWYDYESTVLNGADISDWTDKSPNARNLTQGNAAFRPLAQGLNFGNLIDGLKFVPLFDGVNDIFTLASSYQLGHFFMAMKPVSVLDVDIFDAGVNSLKIEFFASAARFKHNLTNLATIAFNLGEAIFLEYSFDGSNVYCAVNNFYGVSGSGTALSSATGVANQITIGQGNIYVPELISYPAKLSDANRDLVLGYLRNRYDSGGFLFPNQFSDNVSWLDNV